VPQRICGTITDADYLSDYRGEYKIIIVIKIEDKNNINIDLTVLKRTRAHPIIARAVTTNVASVPETICWPVPGG